MSSDEQRTSKVSMEDSESNSEPQNLHENGPSAWFTGTFRSNFKNVFAHLLNEEQSQEVNNSYTKTTLQSDKEQFCIQWCSQVNSRSDSSPVPKCRMWCVRRVEDEATWNPFSGIHFYCIDGITNCQKQLEEMDTPQQPSTWNQANYHIDVGEKSEKFKDEAVRVVKKTFSPGYEWGRRYVMSWQDGTQARFFERFSTSIKQGEGLDLAKKSFMKIMESFRGERK